MMMFLAAMNLLLLAVFLAACTCRVLLGGTSRVIPTQAERQARRRHSAADETSEAEARVGQINLDDAQ